MRTIAPTRRATVVGVLALAALLAVALVAVDPTALCLLPAFALALPLWLRRYPGERLLAALSRPLDFRAGGRARSQAPRPRRPVLGAVRGGLLLACSLAVRPPPGVAVAAGS